MSSQRPPQSQRRPPPRPQAPPPRRDVGQRATMRLRDLHLGDRDSAYYAPRMGDWLLLGLLVVIFLGNGVYIWHQMGANSHAGRAIFFGLLLLCVLWAAIVYTFKLSVCVRVGPHGISVVRGPWRTELAWRDVARLTERSQLRDGQRFRWLVALARDGRRMQIRDDMVLDYQRFRVEVYERFRLWSDHGGTWGTTGGGPYSAKETLPGQTTWWGVGAAALGLPGIYFVALLPETNPLGFALLAGAIVCLAMCVRGALRRQAYTVDAKTIMVRRPFRSLRLTWREVARVERVRTPFGGAIKAGIAVGRLALKLAARTDGRVESFDWTPRIPEYLILRGAGHQVRVRLHRLERPDEMLAWVEFYDNVARRAAESAPRRTSSPARTLTSLPEPQPATEEPEDLSEDAGPVDPWGAGRGGELESTERQEMSEQWHTSAPVSPEMPAPTVPPAPSVATATDDSWLRGEAPPYEPLPSPYQAGSRSDTAPPHPIGERASYGPQRDTVGGQPPAFQPAAQQPPSHPQQPSPHAAFAADWQPPQWLEQEAETDASRGGWEQPKNTPMWPAAQPAPPHEPRTTFPPMQPTPPVQSEYTEQPEYDEWMAEEVEEPEAEEEEDTPPSMGSLAESFAAWRDDASWQRPQLPRFGPPPDADRTDGS